MNGDGRADIVGFASSGVYVSLASGNGHFAAPTFELAAFTPGTGGWISDDLYKRELADVNGDGRADIVGFASSGVYVSLASGTGHFAAPTFELGAFTPGSSWISDDLYKRELADVNGDGRADIVGFASSGVYVSLATGNGHFAAPTFELAAFTPGAGGWISDNLYKRELADVNGDGSGGYCRLRLCRCPCLSRQRFPVIITRSSSRHVGTQLIRTRRPARHGCSRSSTTACGSSPARTADGRRNSALTTTLSVANGTLNAGPGALATAPPAQPSPAQQRRSTRHWRADGRHRRHICRCRPEDRGAMRLALFTRWGC